MLRMGELIFKIAVRREELLSEADKLHLGVLHNLARTVRKRS